MKYKIGFLGGGSEQDFIKDGCLSTATADVVQMIPSHQVTGVQDLKMAI